MATGGQCKSPTLAAIGRKGLAAPAQAKPASAGEPEQTHLIGGYPDEVTVVFVTDGLSDSEVWLRAADSNSFAIESHVGDSESYTFQIMPGGWNGYEDPAGPHPGPAYSACDGGFTAYFNTTCMYTSGLIHTVRLQGLQPGTAYEYRPAGSSRWRSFSTPPALGERISFGVVADLGQTEDSLVTMQHMEAAMKAGRMDSVIFPGDLAYADGFAPAWDSYGRLGEFLWESMPAAYGPGNHEYGSGSENFANFLPRYGWPSRELSRSPSPLWFSYEAGLAHVVMLCSYCETFPGSLQHDWLTQDLQSVDRAKTPWVVASWHTPWYTSNQGHFAEGEDMRGAMEDLIDEAQVDVVFAGHVHAYERTSPIFRNESRCGGAVHITIGDGGNHEGPSCPWGQAEFEWSVYKEFSFGYGLLDLVNSTHAHWSWRRNQDGADVAADEVWLRPSAAAACGTLV